MLLNTTLISSPPRVGLGAHYNLKIKFLGFTEGSEKSLPLHTDNIKKLKNVILLLILSTELPIELEYQNVTYWCGLDWASAFTILCFLALSFFFSV